MSGRRAKAERKAARHPQAANLVVLESGQVIALGKLRRFQVQGAAGLTAFEPSTSTESDPDGRVISRRQRRRFQRSTSRSVDRLRRGAAAVPHEPDEIVLEIDPGSLLPEGAPLPPMDDPFVDRDNQQLGLLPPPPRLELPQ